MDVVLYVDTPDSKVQFQRPLEGPLAIALKEICYVVGYYNISQERGNSKVEYQERDGEWQTTVPDGLYSLSEYEKELQKAAGTALSVTASPYTGKATVSVARSTALLAFMDNQGLLGLETRRVTAGDEVVGTKPVDLLSPKQLFVHCPQIKGDANLHNGRPSDILEVLPVTSARFGYMVTQRIHSPAFKDLAPRSLHELSLEIRDEEGKAVNFHDSYIRYSLLLRRQ